MLADLNISWLELCKEKKCLEIFFTELSRGYILCCKDYMNYDESFTEEQQVDNYNYSLISIFFQLSKPYSNTLFGLSSLSNRIILIHTNDIWRSALLNSYSDFSSYLSGDSHDRTTTIREDTNVIDNFSCALCEDSTKWTIKIKDQDNIERWYHLIDKNQVAWSLLVVKSILNGTLLAIDYDYGTGEVSDVKEIRKFVL